MAGDAAGRRSGSPCRSPRRRGPAATRRRRRRPRGVSNVSTRARIRRRPPCTRLNWRWVPPTNPAWSSRASSAATSTASDAIDEASRSVGSAEFPGRAVGGMGCSTWAGPVVRAAPRSSVGRWRTRTRGAPSPAGKPRSRPRRSACPTVALPRKWHGSGVRRMIRRHFSLDQPAWMDEGGRMTDIDRILAERYDRRGFMRMAGATTLGAAVLAACKKAEDNGGSTGTSGAPHPTHRSNRSPGTSRCSTGPATGTATTTRTRSASALWQQYADQTGDTPQFTLFENDDAAYTKAVAGTVDVRRRPPLRLQVQGLGRPRRDAAVGHLADPELQPAQPQAHGVRASWTASSTSSRSTGGSSPRSSTRPRRRDGRSRSGSCSTTGTRARSRGSTPRT